MPKAKHQTSFTSEDGQQYEVKPMSDEQILAEAEAEIAGLKLKIKEIRESVAGISSRVYQRRRNAELKAMKEELERLKAERGEQ